MFDHDECFNLRSLVKRLWPTILSAVSSFMSTHILVIFITVYSCDCYELVVIEITMTSTTDTLHCSRCQEMILYLAISNPDIRSSVIPNIK